MLLLISNIRIKSNSTKIVSKYLNDYSKVKLIDKMVKIVEYERRMTKLIIKFFFWENLLKNDRENVIQTRFEEI